MREFFALNTEMSIAWIFANSRQMWWIWENQCIHNGCFHFGCRKWNENRNENNSNSINRASVCVYARICYTSDTPFEYIYFMIPHILAIRMFILLVTVEYPLNNISDVLMVLSEAYRAASLFFLIVVVSTAPVLYTHCRLEIVLDSCTLTHKVIRNVYMFYIFLFGSLFISGNRIVMNRHEVDRRKKVSGERRRKRSKP